MEVEQLKPFGVMLDGIDDNTIEARGDEVRALLETHALVVFRGCPLDAASHIRLVGLVGCVLDEGGAGAFHGHIANDPDRQLTPTVQKLMSGELSFHSDLTYTRLPPEVLSLQAIELPSTGGATRFANGALALDTLPDDLRTAVAGRVGRHVYSFAEDYAGPREPQPYAGRHFAADQPIVRRNPRTGRDVLFVTDNATQRVVGMEPDESERLLKRLFAHLYAHGHVYVHDWRPDDLVMWENLELQHSRADFDPSQRRILRRVIAGDPDSQRRHSAEVARQLAQTREAEAVYV